MAEAFNAKNWRDLIKPRRLEVDAESLTQTYGKCVAEPLERGEQAFRPAPGDARARVDDPQLDEVGAHRGTGPVRPASSSAYLGILDYLRVITRHARLIARRIGPRPGPGEGPLFPN